MFAPGSLAPVAIAGLGAVATWTGAFIDHKRQSNKRKLSLIGGDIQSFKRRKTLRMAFRRRFSRRPRRRFGRRRRFRSRRSFKRPNFTRRVRRVIRRAAEPKKIDNVADGVLVTREGDGTNRTLWIMNPISALAQGTQSDQIIGSRVFVKGITFRGMAGLSGEATAYAGCIVRVTLVKSKTNASGMGTSFLEYTSTTTAITNPTQVPPFANVPLFEATGAQQFTGEGFTIPFDTRNEVKVIKSYTFAVNPGADNQGGEGVVAIPTPFKFYFPINRTMVIQDPLEGTASGALGFKWGSYYLVVQSMSNTNDNSNSVNCEMDYRVSTFYCDP